MAGVSAVTKGAAQTLNDFPCDGEADAVTLVGIFGRKVRAKERGDKVCRNSRSAVQYADTDFVVF